MLQKLLVVQILHRAKTTYKLLVVRVKRVTEGRLQLHAAILLAPFLSGGRSGAGVGGEPGNRGRMYIGFIVYFSFLGLARYRVLMAERRVPAAAVRLLRQIKLAGLLHGEGVGSGVIFGADAVRCFCLLCLGSGCCVVSGGRGGSFVPLSCEGVRFYCAIDGSSKGRRSWSPVASELFSSPYLHKQAADGRSSSSMRLGGVSGR
jgi:hypothetical protein